MYKRQAIETLSIIAYHQPVTRAEIEDIRGVNVSPGTIDMLLQMNWIKIKGRRKVLGSPIVSVSYTHLTLPTIA